MKRILALTLCLGALTFALAGCGDKGGTATGEPETPPVSDGETQSSLPVYTDDITTMPSETERNAELEALIVSTFAVPEEYLDSTWYFYNYVDLNDDGTDEIVAAVCGTYVSGTGGDSGLIVFMEDGKMVVNRQLSLVHMPLVVSDEKVGGWKAIIAPYYGGGGESTYHVLRINNEGDKYFNVPDGEAIETLEGVTGTAILYNDSAVEIADGTALSLAK